MAQSKYPFTGPNYAQYGEVPGYVYWPWTDEYYVDPKAAENYVYDSGIKDRPKEPPSAGEQLGMTALAGGALYAGQQLGTQLASGSLPSLGGMLGGGGASAGATAGATGGMSAGVGGGMSTGAGATTAGTTGGAGLGVGGSLGTAGALGIGAAAALAAAHLYNQGGKEVISGKGKTEDYVDLGVSANPMTFWVNPVLDVLGQDSVGKMIGGKSTKDYQKERWGALSPAAQGLYQANHPDGDTGVWQTGKYAGQKWSWEKAKDLAKDDPTHLIGVLGNLETFGDQWLSTPLDKQKEIVRRLLEKDAYVSDKGDILIHKSKKDEARKTFDEVMGTPTQEQPQQQVQPLPTQTPMPSQMTAQNLMANQTPIPRPTGMIPNDVAQRYGADVANQVMANPSVGVGGPGWKWDNNKGQFVRG